MQLLATRPPAPGFPSALQIVVLTALVLSAGGCATSGPNHVYVTRQSDPTLQDLGPPEQRIDRAVNAGEQVLGLAYDYNTDHLFLHLAPVPRIRVIERPSGKILREMPLPSDNFPAGKAVAAAAGSAAAGNGVIAEDSADLAIRSSDRHLFVVDATGRAVIELTLFGAYLRRLELPETTGRIGGLAYDQKNDRLLFLTSSSPARIGGIAPDGHVTQYVTLTEPVRPVSLGYDSAAGHFFVPLADGRSLGEFNATGGLVQTLRAESQESITAVDAGPRSLVRVF